MLEQRDVDEHVKPFACRCMNRPSIDRGYWCYDTSGMGRGTDRTPNDANSKVTENENISMATKTDSNDINKVNVNEVDMEDYLYLHVRSVRNFSMVFYRERLIEHFDILWQQQKIKWRSQRGTNSIC
jgi:hypothetical protein